MDDKVMKIPAGRFAEDNEALRRKREELKRKLLGLPPDASTDEVDEVIQKRLIEDRWKEKEQYIPKIYYPAEIETMKITGTIYGYFNIVTSFYHRLGCEKIGEIFKEKPIEYLSEGITGFYENGNLHFIRNGVEWKKKPYSLFEIWLDGKIDIDYANVEVERLYKFYDWIRCRDEKTISIPRGKLGFCGSIHLPQEIEMMKGEGVLFGKIKSVEGNNWVFVTSNKLSSDCEEIGRIYNEIPNGILPKGAIGFYYKNELIFVNNNADRRGRDGLTGEMLMNFDGSYMIKEVWCPIMVKTAYSLFENWLNGKIDIKCNL
jgi:hypothetical protein